jgi:hypothetical protein
VWSVTNSRSPEGQSKSQLSVAKDTWRKVDGESFGGRMKALQKEPSAQELKLPKPEEPKWIVTVRSRKTHIDRSCISGESAPRESEHEVETSKGRSPEVDQSH